MSKDNLSSIQFNMRKDGQYSDIHDGWAELDGKQIGSIEWFKDDGTVRNIDVDPEHRRKGVATGMWNAAHEFSQNEGLQSPKHDSCEITTPGLSWAESVGGEWSNKRHDR